jgi:hypothetical protein
MKMASKKRSWTEWRIVPPHNEAEFYSPHFESFQTKKSASQQLSELGWPGKWLVVRVKVIEQ